MARKIYYTSKGQPYIKLPNGRPKFISRKSAGMSDTGNLGKHKRTKQKAKKTHRVGEVAQVSLGELGKLVKKAGKCITIITSKGAESFCPSHVNVSRRKAAKR